MSEKLAQPRTAVNIRRARRRADSTARDGSGGIRRSRRRRPARCAIRGVPGGGVAARFAPGHRRADRAGLARQYDAPPVEQTALVLRSNCTVDRLRQMIYWPTKEDAELPRADRSPPLGAPSTHPARAQVTFLMALYRRGTAPAESLSWRAVWRRWCLCWSPQPAARAGHGAFVQFTDESLFPWHDRGPGLIDKAMHQRMLELAREALVLAEHPPSAEEETRDDDDGGRFPGDREWPCARSVLRLILAAAALPRERPAAQRRASVGVAVRRGGRKRDASGGGARFFSTTSAAGQGAARGLFAVRARRKTNARRRRLFRVPKQSIVETASRSSG